MMSTKRVCQEKDVNADEKVQIRACSFSWAGSNSPIKIKENKVAEKQRELFKNIQFDDVTILKDFASVKRKRATEALITKKPKRSSLSDTSISGPSSANTSKQDEEPDWSDCDEELSKSICLLDKTNVESASKENDEEPEWSDCDEDELSESICQFDKLNQTNTSIASQ